MIIFYSYRYLMVDVDVDVGPICMISMERGHILLFFSQLIDSKCSLALHDITCTTFSF